MTVEEYLEFEKSSEGRHEFVDGAILAMAGETLQHDDIVLNIVEAVRPIARAKGCKLHATNVQTRVRQTRYRYPDIVVTCEQISDSRILENPCFIAEVSSKNTNKIDHFDKLAEYIRLPSLQQYVIISQDIRCVGLYKCSPSGWRVEILEEKGEFEIPCLETSITLDQIYAGLEFAS